MLEQPKLRADQACAEAEGTPLMGMAQASQSKKGPLVDGLVKHIWSTSFSGGSLHFEMLRTLEQ